ncbi:MAG: hypothetical protein NC132_01285 [Corallococcus sp.]|nr:hypothetical protein [Corallococcus sp.]MCM1359447.1 hypothetical protein [Corallococcus sp.]MCM1394741.1 hypothetical protein [Corallococcus sp.]
MINVYEDCPSFQDDRILIRKLAKKDVDALLKIYGDKNAVRFFNSDNCHGDDFYYPTKERMAQAVDFWLTAYSNKWFVRWIIVDNAADKIVGTLEAFHRDAADFYDNSAVVRLDLRSDCETTEKVSRVFRLVQNAFFDLFYCDKLVTKGFVDSPERIRALQQLGFEKCLEPLVGQYERYFDYWVKYR